MAGRSARCVHARTTRASLHSEETHAARLGRVIAVRPPASTVIRTKSAAPNCSAAVASVSSSCRRHAPPCPPSTVRPTCHLAAGVCSDGDLVRLRCAPVLGPSTRPARAPKRRRPTSPALARVRHAISSHPLDRALSATCPTSRGRLVSPRAIHHLLCRPTRVVPSDPGDSPNTSSSNTPIQVCLRLTS